MNGEANLRGALLVWVGLATLVCLRWLTFAVSSFRGPAVVITADSASLGLPWWEERGCRSVPGRPPLTNERVNTASHQVALAPLHNCQPPSVVVIGVAKGGTTDFFAEMRHLFRPIFFQNLGSKEIGFVRNCHRQNTNALKEGKTASHCSKEGYRSTFDHLLHRTDAPRWNGSIDYCKILTIDATPSYLTLPGISSRLSRVAPDALTIVMLRNPTTRYGSMYNHLLFRLLNGKINLETLLKDSILDPNINRTARILLKENISDQIDFELGFMSTTHARHFL